jgi:hypothetical protein
MGDSKYMKKKLIEGLETLGFTCIEKDKYRGKIPKEETINNYYIDVILDLTHYPFKSPAVILKSINGNENIYKRILSGWRHIDEAIKTTPSNSIFYVCCFHNWRMKEKFDAKYIYDRIYNWLKSNVNEHWDPEEDARSYRVIPQGSALKIYLTESLIDEMHSETPDNSVLEAELFHNPYKFKESNSKASTKNHGNKYKIEDISFCYAEGDINSQYHFFPQINPKIEIIKRQLFHRLSEKEQCSKCLIIKMNRTESQTFKSIYQLLAKLKNNISFMSKLRKVSYKNLPIIILYEGDRRNREVIALLIDIKTFLNEEIKNIKLKPFQIETLPEREKTINLNVSILGAGSLGGEVAKLTAEKGVKKLMISDQDKFSATNLGFHELDAFNLGQYKAIGLSKKLRLTCHNTDAEDIKPMSTDMKAVADADLVVVTVGDPNSFDKLAFDKLKDFEKPIIWAWVSEYNILQEIVITTPFTGCLNCYYHLTNDDEELRKLQEAKEKELAESDLPSYEQDICGDPHVISKWERMVFLASQIVSIIEYYSNNDKFPFEYINYLWRLDAIYPEIKKGFLDVENNCFCRRG